MAQSAAVAGVTRPPESAWPHVEGSGLRQFQLVPSGCQGWFTRVVGGGGDFFAYASTLAIYVYRKEDFSLCSVLTGHQRTITCLSWSQKDPQRFATSGADGKLVLWNAAEGRKEETTSLPSNAFVVEFSPRSATRLAVACEDKTVSVWDTKENKVTRLCRTGRSSARCVKWNEKRDGLLAIGCKSGQVLLHDAVRGRTTELVSAKADSPPVADLRWDRLSEDYLLVAFRDGGLALYDVERGAEVQRFEKQGASITALEWLPWQPGAFASINGRAGVVRVWNVSQRSPLEVVMVSDRPAWAMSLLPGTTSLLLSFLDGAVAVYDLATRAMRHRGLPGHIETIFDAQFHPADPDTLATASYDSSAKVWHAPSMRCAQTLTGPTGPLYSVAWSPDGARIAASSGKGRLAVWDVSTGAAVWVEDAAHASTSLRVSWSRADPSRLATVGMDSSAKVWDVGLQSLLATYRHPADVMGVDWSPTDAAVFATACADGVVRVFRHGGGLAPFREHRSHSARAFNVAFSPLVPSLLASGGDDHAVVVQDLSTGTAVRIEAHTNKVRALCWHPELPRILLSGAWDGRICVHDAIAGTCLVRHTAHEADVYGLSVHPLRPFTAVSSSRDTSVRFWETREAEPTGRRLALRAACDPSSLPDLRGDAAAGIVAGAPARLCGPGSKRAAAVVREALGGAGVHWGEPPGSDRERVGRARACAAVGALFTDADGAPDMWRLVVRCAEARAGQEPAAGPRRHPHLSAEAPSGAGGDADHDVPHDGDASTAPGAAAGPVLPDPRTLRRMFGGVGSGGVGAGGDATVTPGAALPPLVGQGLRSGGGMPSVLWCEDAAAATRSRAVAVDAARLGEWVGTVGGPSASDLRATAAGLFLRTGDVRRYCDVLAAEGRWDEAIAAAPAAGMPFWRQLAAKRAAMLATDGTEAALPLLVATGDIDGAADLLASRGEAEAAVAMQQCASEGSWDPMLRTAAVAAGVGAPGAAAAAAGALPQQPASAFSRVREPAARGDGGGGEATGGDPVAGPAAARDAEVEAAVSLARRRALTRRDRTARQLADKAASRGAAARAAAHDLSVGDAAAAVQRLLGGGLSLQALLVARALDVRPRRAAAEAVASLLEREGMWEEQLALLRDEGWPAVRVAAVASNAVAAGTADGAAVDAALAGWGHRPRASWMADVAGLASSGRHADAVVALCAAGAWRQASTAGCRAMRVLLLRGDWDGAEVRALSAALGLVRARDLPPRRRARLVAMCAVAGAMQAVRRGAMAVASALFRTVRRLRKDHGLRGMGVSVARLACIEARALLGAGMPVRALRLLKIHGMPPAADSAGADGAADGASPPQGGRDDEDEDEDEDEEAEDEAAQLELIRQDEAALPPPSDYDDDDLVGALTARATAAAAALSPAEAAAETTSPGSAPPSFRVDGASLPRSSQRVEDMPLSAALPPTGAVSGRAAAGPRVVLDEAGRWCTLPEALEWGRCTAFGPMADGSRIPRAVV